MSDSFTVVFAGNVNALDGNPLKIESPFGKIAAISASDVLADNDRLTADNARLTAEVERLTAQVAQMKPVCKALAARLDELEQGRDFSALELDIETEVTVKLRYLDYARAALTQPTQETHDDKA